MAITYTHTANIESPTGYTTELFVDNIRLEIPSILNDNSTVNLNKSENKALIVYQENLGIIKSQLEYIGTVTESAARDDIYMNGVLARHDYAVGTTQGQAIVAKLEETWADEVSSYTTHSKNSVAEYLILRPPYTNNTISFYNFEEPSDAIKTTFNATYEQYNHWYGLKFDTVTESVLAKFVIPEQEMERVDPTVYNAVSNHLPISSYHFYARIHDKSNNVNENIDVYFMADPVFVGAWCTENSYIFPYDITDLTIAPKLLIWGCVYNTVSGEITHVKAYTREEAD